MAHPPVVYSLHTGNIVACNIVYMNQPNTFNALSKCYYILRLDSYYGDRSSLSCEADGMNHMYAVLVATNSGAEIIDMGYSSIRQLLSAWRDVLFANITDFAETE